MTVIVIYIGLILLATALPIPEGIAEPNFPLDKVIHFILFFVLSFLCLRVFKIRDAFIIMLVVATWSEMQQIFIPVRSVETFDIITNFTGGSIPFLFKL